MSHIADPCARGVHTSKGLDPVGRDVVGSRMAGCGAQTLAPSRFGAGNVD
jgi:hypothetical protein